MRIKILIRLKSQILEPQGKVIEKSLSNLGLKNLNNIRQGKLIELDIPDKLSKEERDELITSACKKLLVNEIIEGLSLLNIGGYNISSHISNREGVVGTRIEVEYDKKMDRTKNRPLPMNTINIKVAFFAGFLFSIIGGST